MVKLAKKMFEISKCLIIQIQNPMSKRVGGLFDYGVTPGSFESLNIMNVEIGLGPDLDLDNVKCLSLDNTETKALGLY